MYLPLAMVVAQVNISVAFDRQIRQSLLQARGALSEENTRNQGIVTRKKRERKARDAGVGGCGGGNRKSCVEAV